MRRRTCCCWSRPRSRSRPASITAPSGLIAAYLMCGVALVFAKSQHAILGLAFAAVAVVLACRPARRMRPHGMGRRSRCCWRGRLFTMLSLTPPHYKLFALYNVIFSRLAPHSEQPWEVLREVGLGDQDLKYVDSHAYIPSAPVYNDKWSKEFLQRTSFGKLIWFYVRNPDVAFIEMDRDLTTRRRSCGPRTWRISVRRTAIRRRTLATRFSLWSNLRSCGAERLSVSRPADLSGAVDVLDRRLEMARGCDGRVLPVALALRRRELWSSRCRR